MESASFNRFSTALLCALFSMAIATTSVAQDEKEQQQNSTRKIRVKPGKLAAKIGTGVKWEASVEEALKKAAKSEKPIFWYVPTIRGSFMDRKKVIDRYMMAGPFSWESTRNALNDQYVCVKAVPSRAFAKKFELQPYKFIEPGFLILDPDGGLNKKVDRITTLNPEWFLKLIDAELPQSEPGGWWDKFRAGEWDLKVPPASKKDKSAIAIRQDLLRGMVAFRNGKQAEATKIWKSISERHPEHPLGWKAAAEAEGFGPFVRGFEVHRTIAKPALFAGIDSSGSSAPKAVYSEKETWQRSVQFLLGMQREDGGWVDSDYDFGGTDSLPNVHVAVTSLAAMALLEAGNSNATNDVTKAKIDSAVKRAAEFVTNEKSLNRIDRDEKLWAFAYRTRFLARLAKNNPAAKEKLSGAAKDLEKIQSRRGSWYHEYNNPFVTATALLALQEAKSAGFECDMEKIKLGVASLSNDRFGNGAYPYGSGRGKAKKAPGTEQQIAASAGRMPLCDLALVKWGDKDQTHLTAAIESSFALHENLASALKYDDHTDNMAYGGFFFWYDMRGRSEAIDSITDKSLQKKFFAKQKELIMSLHEIDGCFVDSHELGRCYGTAMALLCLARTAE